MTLQPMQIAGLLISVLGITALAIWSGTRKKAGGNVNSSPIVAGIIMGTLVGGSSTVGTAQLAFHFGLSAWWFTLGGGIACLVLALVYTLPWRKSGCSTLVGMITKEYGPKAGLAASLMSSVGTFINIIAQLIAGTAVIAVILPDLKLVPSLVITAVFMTLYVIFGGTRSAGTAGMLKLVLLYISMISCGVMVLKLCGGLSGFTQMVNQIPNPDGVSFYSLFARGVGKDAGACFSIVLGVLTTQTYAQGVLSGKTDKAARTGALASAFLIPPIGAGGILVGLFMRANFPDLVAKNALTSFATLYLPPAISGVILGTLFIAVVGTGAGLAMGITTIIRRDILQRYSDKLGDEKRSTFISRCIIVMIMALGVILASGSLGDMILSFGFMSMGLRGSVVFLPMCCAIWMHKKVNRNCILAGIILSPLTVLICGTVLPLPGGLDPLFAGMAVSAVCCIAGRIVGTEQKNIRLVHSVSVDAGKMVVAIDSELSSGSEQIAAILSREIGIPCYTSEILTEASRISGISERLLKRYDKRPAVAAYDLGAEDEAGLRLPPAQDFVLAQKMACRQLAENGRCILVDRFAAAALEETGNCIKVFIHADFEERAERFAQENGLGAAAARRRLRKLERTYTRYCKQADRNWGYAGNYAIIANASSTAPEALADEIAFQMEQITGTALRKKEVTAAG